MAVTSPVLGNALPIIDTDRTVIVPHELPRSGEYPQGSVFVADMPCGKSDGLNTLRSEFRISGRKIVLPASVPAFHRIAERTTGERICRNCRVYRLRSARSHVPECSAIVPYVLGFGVRCHGLGLVPDAHSRKGHGRTPTRARRRAVAVAGGAHEIEDAHAREEKGAKPPSAIDRPTGRPRARGEENTNTQHVVTGVILTTVRFK